MSKFDRITEANLPLTVWFAKVCDALYGQISHIRRTLELALKPRVKGFNRDNGPAFQPIPNLSSQFQRHFDPVYGSET